MPIAYPQINKKAYSFSSIELSFAGPIGGFLVVGVQAVDFKASLKPGIVRGTSAKKNGRTLGTYEPSASMTLYKSDADDLIAQLGDGFGEVEFQIHIDYAEEGQPINSVEIIGCRITEFSTDNKEGDEATMVKFELDVMDILIEGKSLVKQARK